jgi:hypothetical protein
MPITFTGSGTKANPIQISGVSTNFEAVRAEYEYLNQRYGKRGVDWKLERQVLIQITDKRMCDVLHIDLADGTKVKLWFDVTPYFGKF